jgi:hypothetical protein
MLFALHARIGRLAWRLLCTGSGRPSRLPLHPAHGTGGPGAGQNGSDVIAEEGIMEKNVSRRRFLGRCAKLGGACCVLLAWKRSLPAQESPGRKNEQGKRRIDFAELSYCGVPCAQSCELYQATVKNDEPAKKLIHEQWNWKKRFGIDYSPDKVFCHTCKPGDKPLKPGMAECTVRICSMANGMESCVQCKNLAACEKELWKSWPQAYEFAKKMQARYLAEPGAVLREIKAGL